MDANVLVSLMVKSLADTSAPNVARTNVNSPNAVTQAINIEKAREDYDSKA